MAREDRYIVVKKSHLTPEQLSKLKSYMHLANVGTVPAVVVEADWPEYEPVWKMIEDRVAGRHRQSSSNAAERGGDEQRNIVRAVIDCYNTARPSGLSAVEHVLSKRIVQDAFAALASLSTTPATAMSDRIGKDAVREALECAKIKLRRYMEVHGPDGLNPDTYVGGYQAEIEAVLKTIEAALRPQEGEVSRG